MSRSRTGPRGLLVEAQALRDEANQIEAKAIRLALEACDWYEAPAADMLGMNRSTLKKALTTRLKEIGDEAAKKRADAGYRGGNPHREK
ncbi:MAG TPA: helix-turn-helix domain-containing protein [Polyangia bacterium]|nr:helix-turn-helix domain-containing protein [Polyangia bacterium]